MRFYLTPSFSYHQISPNRVPVKCMDVKVNFLLTDGAILVTYSRKKLLTFMPLYLFLTFNAIIFFYIILTFFYKYFYLNYLLLLLLRFFNPLLFNLCYIYTSATLQPALLFSPVLLFFNIYVLLFTTFTFPPHTSIISHDYSHFSSYILPNTFEFTAKDLLSH